MSDALTTIITAQEVVHYTPKRIGVDASTIKPFVAIKEEDLFRVYLGLEWYEALKDDLSSHGVVKFVEGTSYGLNTVVLWRDELYISLVGNTEGAKPGDPSRWAKAPKFQTTENEYLWERYLRNVLAWHIMHTSLVYTHYQQGGAGVTKREQPGGKDVVVTAKELAAFKKEIGDDFNSFLQVMDTYLKANKETFGLYKPNQEGDGCGSGEKFVGYPRRNYGFSGIG